MQDNNVLDAIHAEELLVLKVRDANSGLICDPIKSSNIPYFKSNINVYLYFLLKTH